MRSGLCCWGTPSEHNSDDQDAEDDCLGLADALPCDAGTRIERVVDVQGEHLGGVRRGATGKGEVLVEQLKAVGDGQEQADGDRRHQIGNLNLPERLPCRSAVNLGGLDVVRRNGLQTGDVDDHYVADLLPQGQDDKAPEASSGVKGDEVGADVGEQAVDQNLPNVTQHDAADQVGHKEDCTEDVGALERLAGERLGDGQGDHVDEYRRQEGKRHGKEERRGKLRIVQCAHVVLDTDKVRVVNSNV